MVTTDAAFFMALVSVFTMSCCLYFYVCQCTQVASRDVPCRTTGGCGLFLFPFTVHCLILVMMSHFLYLTACPSHPFYANDEYSETSLY